jgi:hypothetical protein
MPRNNLNKNPKFQKIEIFTGLGKELIIPSIIFTNGNFI